MKFFNGHWEKQYGVSVYPAGMWKNYFTGEVAEGDRLVFAAIVLVGSQIRLTKRLNFCKIDSSNKKAV